MHVEADVMTETVNVILAQRFAMQVFATLRDSFDRYEIAISSWMERHGYRLLRIAMGIVFIWFGALKPLGLSPAEAFVAKATAWIPIPGFLYILAVWEVLLPSATPSCSSGAGRPSSAKKMADS